jgi:hypothetical protein
MSRLRLDIQLEQGTAGNQILATDPSGNIQFITAPTANGQSLVRTAGVLGWTTIAGTSYIGDTASHSSGGNLDMMTFNITNASNIATNVLTINDVAAGDILTWTIQENTSNALAIGNPSDEYLTIATGTGQLRLPEYGRGALSGNIVYYLAVDGDGFVVEASSAGGGGNTLYSGDDAITADRILSMPARTLTFRGSTEDIVFDDGAITANSLTFNVAGGDNLTITEEDVGPGTTHIRFKKATSNLLSINEGGKVQFHNYTGTTFAGTVAKILTVDSAGIMLTTQPEINLLSDVDASIPSNGDLLIYDTSGPGEWVARQLDPITINVLSGPDPVLYPGDTVGFPTTTQSGNNIWGIYFLQDTIIDWGAALTTGVKTSGVMVIPNVLDAYSIYSYGISVYATTSGVAASTTLLVNGSATTASTALSTAVSGPTGTLTNALTLGTPEVISAGDVIQVEVTGVTGNVNGLVVFLELRR